MSRHSSHHSGSESSGSKVALKEMFSDLKLLKLWRHQDTLNRVNIEAQLVILE